MDNFRRIFAPTADEREDDEVRILEIWIKAIRNHDCFTCKYCEQRPAMINHHNDYVNYCTKKDEEMLIPHTCAFYEVGEIKVEKGF